jgi:hypothetical protein
MPGSLVPELGCHCAALQCTNQPPDFGGGLFQPVTLLYADHPYIIATEQDGTHPTAFGVVGTGCFCRTLHEDTATDLLCTWCKQRQSNASEQRTRRCSDDSPTHKRTRPAAYQCSMRPVCRRRCSAWKAAASLSAVPAGRSVMSTRRPATTSCGCAAAAQRMQMRRTPAWPPAAS